jgi:hypothetical protein
MSVKHKKTGQDLKKIDRSKRKPKSAAASHGIDTKGMPTKDAKAVEKAAESLPRPKQQHLPAPGMAPTIHKTVDEAAEKLGDAKERCSSATKYRKSCETDLIREMRKVGETHYVNRGLNIEIILETPDRVKLKKYDHNDVDEEKLA